MIEYFKGSSKMSIMIQMVLLSIMCLRTNAKSDSSPQCTCPFGSGAFGTLYCGRDLKELNSNASQKVLQSNCQDEFLYMCAHPKEHARIFQKCKNSCVIPTEEIQMKYNMTKYVVSPRFRWCIKLSETGRTQNN